MTRAREHYTQCLEIFRHVGDLAFIAWSLLPLANIALDADELDESAALYNQSLPMMVDLGDRLGVGIVLLGLGMAEHYRGNRDESQRLIAEAQAHVREGGGGQGVSWGLSNAPVDTRTHDLLLDAMRRYQEGVDLPAAEWIAMVLADGEAWHARPKSGCSLGVDGN